MKKTLMTTSLLTGACLLMLGSARAEEKKSVPAAGAKKPNPALVKRGEFLVTVGGCNDCHTPLKMTPTGPAPDMEHMLSGHPEQLVMPPAPKLPPGPWMVVSSATNTAWAGPWGVSFTANLTSDKETGLGAWSEQTFIDTMKSGKHLGRGRPILPPMPWQTLQHMPEEDLKAVFAYLQSVPAVKNHVPTPIPPPEMAGK